jgi:hypothetical protein
MVRKLIAGTMVVLGSILLVLSIVLFGLIWFYKAPLQQNSTTYFQSIDKELEQAQIAVRAAKLELERTLRLVESTETSIASLKTEFAQLKLLFDDTNGVLDTMLLPGLIESREQISQAKSALEDLRVTLREINSIPLINLNIPGDIILSDLIDSAGSLDAQIILVEGMVINASTFVSDASYLMGADFTETKNNLQNFLEVVQDYDLKITGWRTQIKALLGALPGWFTGISIGLTVFLLWFGFSQIWVIKSGLLLRGGDTTRKLAHKELIEDDQ